MVLKDTLEFWLPEGTKVKTYKFVIKITLSMSVFMKATESSEGQ